ncbi:putative protein serine/threonine kinase [Cavenderia fasciculata]|uniref:Protein kinase domain-containing protein n=1 Tax=Cavenderia fasciculata TaxID=261658 RepID=F4PK37_CACFS|nr:putative protein serine/threonine kinase [Cavenderia fasciculata]EGG23961.1 putative protein serine/threonine kinase [Cavenderia fasciculata]|eukprot:XP_004361812.1 putative protein serine/threonine kinase [Cavenderia fasciculata]
MDTVVHSNDLLSGYKLVAHLRSGGEGRAILMEKDGQKYVCKQRIFENIFEANAGLKEAYSLASIKHENIIGFEEVFLRTVPGDDQIYLCIITEFCSKGDLLDYLFDFIKSNGNLGDSSSSSSLSSTSTSTTTSSSMYSLSEGIEHSISTGSMGSYTGKDSGDDVPIQSTSTSTTSTSKIEISSTLEFSNSFKLKETRSMNQSMSSLSIQSNNNNSNNSTNSVSSPKSSWMAASPFPPLADPGYIPKAIAIEWLTQLCLAMQSLHREHLIHRDIKSENVFIGANDTLKIGDFGLATKSGATTKNHGKVGTYNYSAPEVLNGKSYDRSADIFSLGCVFYEVLTLKLLVQNRLYFGEEILQDKFDKMKFLSDFPSQYQYLGPLVLKMLDGNSALRPSIESILNKLNGTQNMSNKSLVFTPKRKLTGIRKQLGKGDIKEASEVLGRALAYDLRFSTLFAPDDPESTNIRTEFMKFTLKIFIKRRGQIWGYYGKDNKLQSVSIWHTPDVKKNIRTADLWIGKLKFVTKVGLARCRMAGQTLKAINEIMTNENGDKNWFLPYIGTDEQYRGNGVGTYVVESVLEWADHSGYLAKTLCLSKDSFPFFQRLGFEVDKEIRGGILPSHVEVVYILKRPPRLSLSTSDLSELININ